MMGGSAAEVKARLEKGALGHDSKAP